MPTAPLPPRAVMLRAVRRRSPAFDERVFYVAVRSTGIVCRPTCPSRPAKAANLVFYATLAQARGAGYRACKRCRPEQPRPEVGWVTALLDGVRGPRRAGPPGVNGTRGASLVAGRVLTPLGAMLGVASERGLLLLEFGDRPMLATQLRTVTSRFGLSLAPGKSPWLTQVRRELGEWFAGRRRTFDVPLDVRGSAFQEAAWRALHAIPYGGTASYEEQARRIGRARAQRAVGRSNGDNRLAIVIPCHRVIRADGTLSGYGGGVWRKRALLDLEWAAAGRAPAFTGRRAARPRGQGRRGSAPMPRA